MIKLDQRGTLLEIPIVFVLGVMLLSVGIPHLAKGNWLKGLVFAVPGALLLIWLAWFVVIGPLLEERRNISKEGKTIKDSKD